MPADRRSYGSIQTQSSPQQTTSTLNFLQRIGYGFGHVYNDLCAAVWFSYVLLYLHKVRLLPSLEAGGLVMLGQVSDAIATPIVGWLTDKWSTKQKWHMFGTLLIFISFPLMFSVDPTPTNPDEWWWSAMYYGVIVMVFQFAWAMVQITHLAIIPEMSLTGKDRDDLSSVRYSASICANIFVYIVAWIMFKQHSAANSLTSADGYRFRDISLILTLVGMTMTSMFHFSITFSGYGRRRLRRNEQQNAQTSSSEDTEKLISSTVESQPKLALRNLIRSPQLYQVSFLYVCARLFMTSALVYFPLWLDERSTTPANLNSNGQPSKNLFNSVILSPIFMMRLEGENIQHLAIVPLVSFFSSFVSSVTLKHFKKYIGNEASYLVGSAVSIVGCVLIQTIRNIALYELYIIAVVFGAGSAITMVVSLSLTADLVGNNTQYGGFIYSTVTFADKLITGIIVVTVESLKCTNQSDCPQYYRYVLAGLCGISAILGLFILATMKVTRNRRSQESVRNVVD